MWRKRNPHILLVGIPISIVTIEMENSMEISHKFNSLPCDPAIPLLDIYLHNMNNELKKIYKPPKKDI